MDEEDPDRAAEIHPDSHRLLCDVMLGKLVVYLRMCGYDTAYVGDRDVEADDRIRNLARQEDRVLLSRDTALVSMTDGSRLLTETDIEGQLAELRAAGVELTLAEPPTRCGRCNGVLEAVPPDVDRPDYAPAADEFDCWRCRACGQFFWKGSHWDRVREAL